MDQLDFSDPIVIAGICIACILLAAVLSKLPRGAPTFELHGYQIDYLRKMADTQNLGGVGDALQSIVDRAMADASVQEEIFSSFWCVHCGSKHPAAWIASRKGRKAPYPLAVDAPAAAFLAGDLLRVVRKVGEPPARRVVQGEPRHADRDKAARMCVDWAIDRFGPDAKVKF